VTTLPYRPSSFAQPPENRWRPAARPLGAQLDLVGLGEALVLLQPPAGASLAAASNLDVHVAGAELNAGAALARLGGRAALCTRLGADPFATRVRATAEALGVELLAEADPQRPTGVFFKDVRPDGLRHVYYYRSGSAAAALGPRDIARVWSARPRVVLVSGLTAALGDEPRRAVESARTAREHGIALVVDVNLRPQLGRTDDAVRAVRSLLPAADLLIVGTDESTEIFGTRRPADIVASANSAGCGEVVVKAGADGCWWTDETGNLRHLPSLATRVVDPVGAGDAFTGGYIAGRLSGASAGGAAWLGAVLAAGVVANVGDTAGLPDRAEAATLVQRAVAWRAGVDHVLLNCQSGPPPPPSHPNLHKGAL